MTHGVTLQSAEILPQVAGWNWRPALDQPISHLIWLPFKLLPLNILPWALNIFNAVCAALVLVCLARIVVLFPQDRNETQRRTGDDPLALLQSPLDWLPPLLAAVALGCQVSFWEQATSVSSRMPALLLLAYSLRCLAEFRIDRRQAWLSRAAFVYGLGMSESWALAGLMPLFVVVVIWVNGQGFFNFSKIKRVSEWQQLHRLFDFNFVWRTGLWGVAGSSLYLLSPWWQSQTAGSSGGFWVHLREVLHLHRECLSILYYYLRSSHGLALLICTALLPLVPVGLRWHNNMGRLETWLIQLMHLVLLLGTWWLAFSPVISPRVMIPKMSFLPYYFCCALAVGFYAGYFLQVCRSRSPEERSARRIRGTIPKLREAGKVGIVMLLAITMVGLPGRSWPQVYLTNHLLGDFMKRLTATLPGGPLSMASDDPALLSVVQSGLVFQRDRSEVLCFDTISAGNVAYQIFEHGRYPGRWPELAAVQTNQTLISADQLEQFYRHLAGREPVYFLQPNFGPDSEVAYGVPQGLIWRATLLGTNDGFAPGPNDEVIRANESFWQEWKTSVEPVLTRALDAETPRRNDSWSAKIMARINLEPLTNATAEFLAGYYSRAADAWGVELQRAGQWELAGNYFVLATRLSPDNPVAAINMHYNAERAQKAATDPAEAESMADSLAKYKHWDQLRAQCGPVDVPLLLALEGDGFAAKGWYRQAAGDFFRISRLMPDNISARIALAEMYCNLRQPARALEQLHQMETTFDQPRLDSTNQALLTQMEIRAEQLSGNTNQVMELCRQLVAIHPGDLAICLIAVQYGLEDGQAAQSLRWLEAWPGDRSKPLWQAARGWTLLQLQRFDEAAAAFSRALAVEPKNVDWRYARAQSWLGAGEMALAAADYRAVLAQNPRDYRCQYGLAEVAMGTGETNQAVAHWEAFLQLAPAELPTSVMVRKRLAETRSKL